MPEVHEFFRVLRHRFLLVALVTAVGIGAAAIWLARTPEQYVATTRLFISGASATSQYDAQQGGIYAQDRVVSYEQLVTSRAVAQRTIDALKLDMDAKTLAEHVSSKSTPNSAVMDVSVTADSPTQAKDIANSLSEQFVMLANSLETPPEAAAPVVRVTVLDTADNGKSSRAFHGVVYYVIGGLLGFLLGVLTAFVWERYMGRIRDRVDVERYSGARPLSELPASSRTLIPLPNQQAREAFRRLWLNTSKIQASSPQVVCITSAPGAGTKMRKTFTAAAAINLAGSLIADRKSVVLLVCDPDPEVVSLVFRYRRTQLGFSDGADLPVEIELVYDESPSSSFADQKAMFESIKRMRSEYEHVVALLPPVTEVAGAAAVASAADGVLVVGTYNRSTRRDIEEVVTDLGRVRATFLGTAFVRRNPMRGMLRTSGGAKRATSGGSLESSLHVDEDQRGSERRNGAGRRGESKADVTLPLSLNALNR